LLVFHREEWSACHNFYAGCFTTPDDRARRFTLYDHGADKYIVGPCHVFFSKINHIEINQPFFPLGRQHGRNSQQTQRGRTRLLLDKLKRMFETPKGVWKFRI
jgi:hypothetical protein